MGNSEPNKIVNKLFNEFLKLRSIKDANLYDYKKEETLKGELANITRVVGAISVMSKNSILKLVKMQSSLRFMSDHSFYIQFARACEDILSLND